MPAYAIGHLRHLTMGPPIVEYLQNIDATLAPFEGRFIVHGGSIEVLEGTWVGNLIIIAFPNLERARAWYQSAAYQAILRLRTDNAEGEVVLVEGVSVGHRATDILES